jgi:molecular chaperone IbpA
VKVVGASLKDGMLSIELVREVPEALKPRRIEIANGNQPQIESAAAA